MKLINMILNVKGVLLILKKIGLFKAGLVYPPLGDRAAIS